MDRDRPNEDLPVRTLRRFDGKDGVRFIAVVALVAVIAVLVWQAIDGSGPDATTLGLIGGGLIAAVALCYPRGFIALGSRISNVDAFGIKIALKDQEETLEEFDVEEDGTDLKYPASWPESDRRAIELVSDELRKKLRFTWVAVYGQRQSISEEYILTHLGLDGVLRYKEGRLSLELLTDLHTRLGQLGPYEREKFLRSAWAFASRFASEMWVRKARRELAMAGWTILEFAQGWGHRPDFRIEREGLKALAAARVAEPRKTVLVTAERLGRSEAPGAEQRRVIVVPDHTDHLWEGLDKGGPVKTQEDVMVIRIGRLIEDPNVLMTDLNPLPVVSE